MILERAAYLLDTEYLTEAICDKSIPNAVEWVENWLAKTGRGKNPVAGTGVQSRFNNVMYYNRTRTTPNYNQIGLDAVAAAKEEDRANGETHDQAYYDDIKKKAVDKARADEQEERNKTHDQSLAESLVEGIVATFSHPIDYERKGWAKMFVQAFTRIAFTECDYHTDHPNDLKINRLQKAYLTATMMWKAAKQNFGSEEFRNLFGDDPNMQGIGYNQLMNAVKGHYQEALQIWTAEKENYIEMQKELQAKNKLIKAYYETAYPNATEEEMKKYLKNNPDHFEPTAEAIAAMRAENDEAVQQEIENYLNDNANNEQQEEHNEPAHIPDINEEGSVYPGVPNPYMEGSIRCGNYNVTKIHNFQESSTWCPFQNKAPDGGCGSGISWCLSYGSEHWRSYIGGRPERSCYFIWTDDFRKLKREDYPQAFKERNHATADTPWGRSLMCIIVKNEGPVRPWVFVQATSRYNHGDGNGTGYGNIAKSGDDFFSLEGNTVEPGAQVLARLMGTTPEEVMKKMPANNRNVSVTDAINAIVQYIDSGNIDISQDPPHGSIWRIENATNKDEYYIELHDTRDKYALVIGNTWVNRTWYTSVPKCFPGVPGIYLVRLDDGLYNLVTSSGKYLLPDNYKNIKLLGHSSFFSYSNRYCLVRLNTENQLENIYDIKTRKFILKKPVYKLVDSVFYADTWENGIRCYLTEDDYNHDRISLITPRGKIIYTGDENHKIWFPKEIKKYPINKYFIFMRENENLVLKSRADINGPYILSLITYEDMDYSHDGWFLGAGKKSPTGTPHNYVVTPDLNIKALQDVDFYNPTAKFFIPNTHKICIAYNNKIAIFDADDEPDNDGFIHPNIINTRNHITFPTADEYSKLTNSAIVYTYLANHGGQSLSYAETNQSIFDTDTQVITCKCLNDTTYVFIGKTLGNATRWYYGTFTTTGEVNMVGPKSTSISTRVPINIINADDEAYFTIKFNGRTTKSLFDSKCKEISHDYDDYHYIGHGLFLVDLKASNMHRNMTTNKHMIIKKDGMPLFNKQFDVLVSAPGDEGYGIVRDHTTEYYYNTLGDYATSLEDFNESVKVPVESVKNNFLYEAAAYLC